ncbi:hypothetical protein [Ruminococcus albus]|uniref:Uncharacterized protein n=1 Tax=Ruminococcus albus TaxID=1264 RepID=A0A1I1RBX8_RUMAL|nr:hypothetical protein [Ruminococcus albus]SFD31775.1 hypothetical protein SAMN02910406_03654 [Ruminococcus albus]
MNISIQKLYERYKLMFDKTYKISLCQENDIDEVLRFIDTYWKRNHAIIKSKLLLDWQYYNPEKHSYNFVIARSKTSNDIHALEGFIPTSQFDKTIKNVMTWGSIWKAIPNIAPPGLGFVVKQYREKEFGTFFNCEVGISSDAEKYNKQFENTIFFLENWYIINPYIKTYYLLKTSIEGLSVEHTHDSSIDSKIIDKNMWVDLSDESIIPQYKSKAYYCNRYFNHPVYKYHSLLLYNKLTEEKEFLFYRVVEHNCNYAIFIVDFIGNGSVLAKSKELLVELLVKYNAEYILFPNYGLKASYLKEAGFFNRKDTNDIVPLYYEPFIKENVDIICASKSRDINWCTFKGDSDQDRPSIL